jgi:hypothetical protein
VIDSRLHLAQALAAQATEDPAKAAAAVERTAPCSRAPRTVRRPSAGPDGRWHRPEGRGGSGQAAPPLP